MFTSALISYLTQLCYHDAVVYSTRGSANPAMT